jgi:uncharacterized protein YeaO (DUF488 family)
MAAVLKTKRWNDPVEADDGFRLLVCRYRPRGLRRERENWDEWWPQLAPGVELHAEAYGKNGPALDWDTYRARYLVEMQLARPKIEAIVARIAGGESVSLLCSSACVEEARCHRVLLRELVEATLGREARPPAREEASPLPAALREWLE